MNCEKLLSLAHWLWQFPCTIEAFRIHGLKMFSFKRRAVTTERNKTNQHFLQQGKIAPFQIGILRCWLRIKDKMDWGDIKMKQTSGWGDRKSNLVSGRCGICLCLRRDWKTGRFVQTNFWGPWISSIIAQICLYNCWKYVPINLKKTTKKNHDRSILLFCVTWMQRHFPYSQEMQGWGILILIRKACFSLWCLNALVTNRLWWRHTEAGSVQDVTRCLSPLHEIQRPFFGALCHCRVDSFETKCSASYNPPSSVRSHCPYSLDLLF